MRPPKIKTIIVATVVSGALVEETTGTPIDVEVSGVPMYISSDGICIKGWGRVTLLPHYPLSKTVLDRPLTREDAAVKVKGAFVPNEPPTSEPR